MTVKATIAGYPCRVPDLCQPTPGDLRAAAAAGMRTAYVPRPDGDPPGPDDSFDLHATSIKDLDAKLLAMAENA